MIDWSSVESLKAELRELGLTRASAEVRRDPHPPLDRQAGGGSGTGSPHPQPQNHPKSVDNFSTHDKLLKPEDVQVGGAHYKGLAIQPMRYSMANNLNACQHTAIKYVTRYKDKGTPIEDLRKAIHCIELLIQFELEDPNNDNNKNEHPENLQGTAAKS